LDYSDHPADIVASWILVTCWWRPSSYYFGDRCDSRDSQARHRSGSVDLVPNSHKCEDNEGCPTSCNQRWNRVRECLRWSTTDLLYLLIPAFWAGWNPAHRKNGSSGRSLSALLSEEHTQFAGRYETDSRPCTESQNGRAVRMSSPFALNFPGSSSCVAVTSQPGSMKTFLLTLLSFNQDLGAILNKS
jgi:hypothetical protein